MDRMSQQFMAIKQAAEFLGISIATLRRWHDNGSFTASFVSPGGHRYYSVADLEKKTKGLFQMAREWMSTETPYLPPQDFYCATSDLFKFRHEKLANEMDRHGSWQSFSSFISSATGEIGNNSFDHNLGNWPDIAGVFFAYDLGKRIIVLADRGVGILATLRLIRPQLANDKEALRVAFTETISCRMTEHRGNGLKYVREAIARANANLAMQTGCAVLEITKGKKEFNINETETPVRGSLTLIRF